MVGRQKNTVTLELTKVHCSLLCPLPVQAQVKPLTVSLFLFSTCLTTRTGTSLAVWQTLAGSPDTPMWSTGPSAMVVPLSFLRALLSILTLVSEVTHGSRGIPQHPEIHSRQEAGSLRPGHEQQRLCCLSSSLWAVPSRDLQGELSSLLRKPLLLLQGWSC